MTIPRAPLLLGLAGLLPFLWGVATMLLPDLGTWAARAIGPRFVGPYVQLAYGTVILSFMSGVLWGFATRATGAIAASGYALSTVPALWAFFLVGGGPVSAAIYLALGFAGILALDLLFWRQDLAPPWWMQLRLLLTAIVVLSLLPIIL
ncbi:DUF3429 domain-containing protein [Maribius pontilimi]|uniref:DUF3429 domain-containing protein n=1 Tax=Palleronia pontilimi TaxID=1964209 RepID=A0A934MIF0_9RHOB|nr:DUF3429 domain-containing protein [Palleronia pontilimi]MBJ3764194.1 DUF3429 domain-containing protein [Palleronia pontilimi]